MQPAKTWLYYSCWIVLVIGVVLILTDQPFFCQAMMVLRAPLLFAYLFSTLKPTHSKRLKVYFILAIVLCFVGDVFKLMDSSLALYISIGGYSIASILYILAFNTIKKIKFSNAVHASLIFTFSIGLVYILFFYFLKHDIPDQSRIPLMAYLTFACLAACAASNILTSNTKGKLASGYFLPAASLCVLSIFVYIFNKYKFMEPKVEAMVFLTYGYAQLLYVDGFRKTSK